MNERKNVFVPSIAGFRATETDAFGDREVGNVAGRTSERENERFVGASVSEDATGECTSETGINDRAGALREICAGFLAQVACGCH